MANSIRRILEEGGDGWEPSKANAAERPCSRTGVLGATKEGRRSLSKPSDSKKQQDCWWSEPCSSVKRTPPHRTPTRTELKRCKKGRKAQSTEGQGRAQMGDPEEKEPLPRRGGHGNRQVEGRMARLGVLGSPQLLGHQLPKGLQILGESRGPRRQVPYRQALPNRQWGLLRDTWAQRWVSRYCGPGQARGREATTPKTGNALNNIASLAPEIAACIMARFWGTGRKRSSHVLVPLTPALLKNREQCTPVPWPRVV